MKSFREHHQSMTNQWELLPVWRQTFKTAGSKLKHHIVQQRLCKIIAVSLYILIQFLGRAPGSWKLMPAPAVPSSHAALLLLG
jgi:hypothetical protein